MKIKLTFLLILSYVFSFAQNEFITVWKPSNQSNQYTNTISTNTQINFPGIGTNYYIYWEEVGNPSHKGNLTNVNSSKNNPVLINFGNGMSSDAQYILKVSNGTGTFSNIESDFGDNKKLLEVKQWGTIKWTTMASAFLRCENLDATATDIPDLSNLTNLSSMFSGCKNLKGNSSFSLWNTSKVTNMIAMFISSENFNQDIGNWDVSNVNDMSTMFSQAINFNQNIGNWNTSKVVNMTGIFTLARKFNQDIGNWNTSNVQYMTDVFYGATDFNKYIGNWNTSKVIGMSGMFKGAENFNQDISNWDTSKVGSTRAMFSNAKNFNQDITNWNTSNVNEMAEMFESAIKFNQNIGNWNTSKVTSMFRMFYGATNFNQDIGNWNTSKVRLIFDMFKDATSFNQNIGNWDVSSAISMYDMFRGAINFNQNIGNWNIKSATTIEGMLYNSNINCLNYNKLLIGWANNPNIPNNLKLTDSNHTYSSQEAVNARNYLINTKGWTITGDIYNPSCALATNEIQNKKLQVYPNPARDFILIDNLKDNVEFEMYDIQGKLVKKEKYYNSQISLKNLTKGVYIIKIPSENYSQKIIIE